MAAVAISQMIAGAKHVQTVPLQSHYTHTTTAAQEQLQAMATNSVCPLGAYTTCRIPLMQSANGNGN